MLADQALAPPPKRGRRAVRTIAQARAEFPKAEQVTPATRETLAKLKARFLTLQPEARAEVAPYVTKYQAMFTHDGLVHASPEDLWGFVTSSVIANPGNLGTFYAGWKENGPEATSASLRHTIEYLLRGSGEDEDRLTDMIQAGTKGVGVVLLTKVLCITQPERFLAVLPYASDKGKGKQDIGRLVFGLPMPNRDSTGMSPGRLAYWSNDLLREALLALPGDPFPDLEHAKHFLWHVFCHLKGWPSEFDELPAVASPKPDPAEAAISEFARNLTAGQGYINDPLAVEKVGMDQVTAYFEDQTSGWTVVHVDREKCGWDITATRGAERWCVEVKATSGGAPTVFVTANELDKAETNEDWIMAVVTHALTPSPALDWYASADVSAAARPVVYRARLDAAEPVEGP